MTYSERELNNLRLNLHKYGKHIILNEFRIRERTIERLIEQAQLANEMGELLFRLQWMPEHYSGDKCPICDGCKDPEFEEYKGHSHNCPLGNALAKWQAE